MTEYMKKPIKVGGCITNGISLGRRKIKIQLTKKDGSEDLILTLTNVFYLSNSLSNLVSLDLLNDAKIYHHNKNQTLYDQST